MFSYFGAFNFKDYHRTQKKLLQVNNAEITASNSRITRVMLIVSISSFAVLIAVSFALPSYTPLRIPYLSMCVLLCIIYFICAHIKTYSIVLLTYIVYALLVGYAAFASVFITPDYTCVIVLFFLIQIPLVIIDKTWRTVLITLLYTAAYMIIAIPHKDPRLISDEILNCVLFSIIGIILGETIKKIRLENFELKRLSIIKEQTDYLTGLKNRRLLFSFLGQLEKSRTDSVHTGVMLIDVDFFKQFNDTYGHQAGDNCLKRIGSCLKRFGEENGFDFFRYGGEEFVGIKKNVTAKELTELAAALNAAVAALDIPHILNEPGIETISIGFSVAETSFEINTLLSQADTALYEAKKAGRNCAVQYKTAFDKKPEDGLCSVCTPHMCMHSLCMRGASFRTVN